MGLYLIREAYNLSDDLDVAIHNPVSGSILVFDGSYWTEGTPASGSFVGADLGLGNSIHATAGTPSGAVLVPVTIDTIQDIRTTASPIFTGATIGNVGISFDSIISDTAQLNLGCETASFQVIDSGAGGAAILPGSGVPSLQIGDIASDIYVSIGGGGASAIFAGQQINFNGTALFNSSNGLTLFASIFESLANGLIYGDSSGNLRHLPMGSSSYLLGMTPDATGHEYKQLIAGSNISITPATGSITVACTINTGSFQPLASNLTSLASLVYASNSFVKMSGVNTFSLDTNSYVAVGSGSNLSTGTSLQITSGSGTGAVLVPLAINTIQGIRTSDAPQFARLGLGTAASSTSAFTGACTLTDETTGSKTAYALNSTFRPANPADPNNLMIGIGGGATLSGGNNFGSIRGINWSAGWDSTFSGSVTTFDSIRLTPFTSSSNSSFGTISTANGINITSLFLSGTGTGSITTMNTINITNPTTGSVTLTNNRAIVIANQTTGINNTNIAIGSATTGNWSIYNNSTNNNFFAGKLGIGVSPTATLDIASTLSGSAKNLNMSATRTDTSGTVIPINLNTILNHASTSSADFRGVNAETTFQATSLDVNTSEAIFAINRFNAASNATALTAVYATGFYQGSAGIHYGTITNVYGVQVRATEMFSNGATGSITNAYGVYVGGSTKTSGSITNLVGSAIIEQTIGTNNTNLLIGTATTGNWGIYNNSAYSNYFANKLGIGVSPLTTLHIRPSSLSLTSGSLNQDSFVIEAADAEIGLYSNNGGSIGSEITFGEINAGALVNKWAFRRHTTNSATPNVFQISYGTDPNPENNSQHMTINTVGNIGIGPSVTTPSSILQVNGLVQVNRTCTTTQTIVAGYGAVIPSDYEIASGVTLELASSAILMII